MLLSSGTDFLCDGEPLDITTEQASKCHHVNNFVHADTVNPPPQTSGRNLRYFLVLKYFKNEIMIGSN